MKYRKRHQTPIFLPLGVGGVGAISPAGSGHGRLAPSTEAVKGNAEEHGPGDGPNEGGHNSDVVTAIDHLLLLVQGRLAYHSSIIQVIVRRLRRLNGRTDVNVLAI